MKWILLRGWAREARHWGHFPDDLRAALPGAEVLALDLPGNGALSGRRSPATVAEIVEVLHDAHQTGDGRVYLLGLSLGAMVCVEWAKRYAGEVAGCVLINTSLRPFSRFYERLRPQAYATIVRHALFPTNSERREAAILRLTSASACADGTLVAAWAAYANERPVSRANVLRQLLAAARYRASASPPPVPLLVLASRGDWLVNPACSISLARAWQAPFAIHPDAGHDLTLDDGAWVTAQIAEWLRRRGAPASDSAGASRP